MKIAAIIQARIASTRLPKKILKFLPYDGNITVLEQVIRRLKRSKRLNNNIILAVAEEDEGDLINIAEKEQIMFFKGSINNVLSRYYLAAKENNLNVVVRITSDCPCIDSEIVDAIIDKHITSKTDYTSNTLTRTYPRGFDVEVFNFTALDKAHKNAKKSYEIEHVTPYIYKNPNLFNIIQHEAPKALYAPDIRITLDTEEDYALLCFVFDYLYPKNPYFTAYDVINLFNAKPWLKLVNKKVIQKKIFNSLEEELKEAIDLLDSQDLKRVSNFLKRN